MENFFFRGFSLFLLFTSFFGSLFLFIGSYFFRESFGFPGFIKEIFEGFAFNEGELFLDFHEELNFDRLLIGVGNVFFDDFLDLLLREFDADTAVFFELL